MKRIVAGRLGGNPNLVNQAVKQGSNQNPTPSSSSSSSSSSSGKSFSPKKGKNIYVKGHPVFDLVTLYFEVVGKRGARGRAQEKAQVHLNNGISIADLIRAVNNCGEYHRLNGTEDRHKMLAQTFFYQGWEDARWWPDVQAPKNRDGPKSGAQKTLENIMKIRGEENEQGQF